MFDGRSLPAVRARARHDRVRVRATLDDKDDNKAAAAVPTPSSPNNKAGTTAVAPSSKATSATSATSTSKPASATTQTTSSTPSTTAKSSSTTTSASSTQSSTSSHTSQSSSTSLDRGINTPSVPAASGHAGATLAASASPSISTTPKPSAGLSGGAVGGIVAAVLLVLFGAIIIFVRKTMIRRRQLKRNTWGAGIFPAIQQEKYDIYSDSTTANGDFNSPSFNEKSARSPSPIRSIQGPNDGLPVPLPSPANILTPPPMSYNNPIAGDIYGTNNDNAPLISPLTSAGMPIPNPGTPGFDGETAVVRCIFIPSLPDELPITAGDIVRVIKAFDDGWALCADIRGETGVVPQECLELSSPAGKRNTTVSVASGDYRDMRRVSSLANGSAYGS